MTQSRESFRDTKYGGINDKSCSIIIVFTLQEKAVLQTPRGIRGGKEDWGGWEVTSRAQISIAGEHDLDPTAENKIKPGEQQINAIIASISPGDPGYYSLYLLYHSLLPVILQVLGEHYHSIITL